MKKIKVERGELEDGKMENSEVEAEENDIHVTPYKT